MHATLALIALAVDAAWGYPNALFRVAGHPVGWIGWLIAWCDSVWNDPRKSFALRRLIGAIALLVWLAAALVLSSAIVVGCERLLPWWLAILAVGVAAAALIAQRSLYEHVAAVADALEAGDLVGGRRAVSQIVGRDTAALSEGGVARAAIESLAENFSDGVVAPIFWLVAAGLPGAALYKTINTADSMVGHRSERYLAFGWAAARLDDLVNLPASRLAALWLVAAAAVQPETSAGAAVKAVWRDARRHRSLNAGWPESAMAGALGLRLAGPRVYNGVVVSDAWMGEGSSDADGRDIRRALKLYSAACLMQGAAVAIVALLAI
jgi:adenosylcobinamide-phosphate synthase